MAKCSDNLLDLQEQLKRELQGEIKGVKEYQELAAKFAAEKEAGYSETFTLLGQAEQMHKLVIEGLVDAIDLRCGKEVSSQKGT